MKNTVMTLVLVLFLLANTLPFASADMQVIDDLDDEQPVNQEPQEPIVFVPIDPIEPVLPREPILIPVIESPDESSGGNVASGSSRQSRTYNIGNIGSSSQEAKRGDTIYFTLKGELHSARVSIIGNGYVELDVNSESFKARIYDGYSNQYDLDNDNVNDLEIKLDSHDRYKVGLTFSEILPELVLQQAVKPQPVIQQLSQGLVEDRETGLEAATGKAAKNQVNSNQNLALVVVLGILAIGLTLFNILRR